jgi:hypothetical protein
MAKETCFCGALRRMGGRAQDVHFSATNAVLSGLPLAPLPHICHAGGQAFSTQPGAGHHVFFR